MKHLGFALLLGLIFQTAIAQKDKEGSKDHPLINRFDGSSIYDYEQTSFNLYHLAIGSEQNGSKVTTQVLEGKITRIFYTLPTTAGSTYEIFSNYKNALEANQATILFSCNSNATCGKYFWENLPNTFLMPAYYGEDMAYLAAKFAKSNILYYVIIVPGYGLSEQGYEVHIVETKNMEQQISIEGIEKAMDTDGKVSLYGILFDTGSDQLQASSYSEIELVAKFLDNHPSKKVYVVGHTDNTGSFNSNMTLSEKRAAAVVNTLVSKYKIDPSRLKAIGIGPSAPKSKNTSEEGKKKNRRVEIVLNEI